MIHMPVGFAKMTNGPHTWGFNTAPQKHANNCETPYAQARVIGGRSSINAEIFRQHSLHTHAKAIHFPDDSVKTQQDSEAYARQYGTTSCHPSCTCKMGTNEMAVADTQCHVRVSTVSACGVP